MSGLIYKLVSDETTDIYIGKTIDTLPRVLSTYKSKYKSHLKTKDHYMECFQLIKYSDVQIKLIEEVDFNAEYLANIGNTDLILRMKHQYWLDNLEHVKQKAAISTIEERTLYKRDHYHMNKTSNLNSNVEKEINRLQKAKYMCSCMGVTSEFHIPIHEISLQHQSFIVTLKEIGMDINIEYTLILE
jgi:hypothetical protein